MSGVPNVPPTTATGMPDWMRRVSQAINAISARTTDVGTTAQRPAKPAPGQGRYNTTLAKPEWWDAAAGKWRDATGTII